MSPAYLSPPTHTACGTVWCRTYLSPPTHTACGTVWCRTYFSPPTHTACGMVWLFTYLCPSLPVEHSPSTTPRHRTLFWAAQTSSSLTISALLQCLAFKCCEAGLSSSSPAGSRSGLGVWCWWLLEVVSDPAPLLPQYLVGHWFLFRSLPDLHSAGCGAGHEERTSQQHASVS